MWLEASREGSSFYGGFGFQHISYIAVASLDKMSTMRRDCPGNGFEGGDLKRRVG
jgi:hypothetical protein